MPGDPTARLDAKKKTVVATERDDTERANWRHDLADRDATQFVFLDESSANVTLTPRYARAPKGRRAQGSAPRNHDQNTTLVAALTPEGIQAPMLLLGALNGDAFAAYVEHVLVPSLTPGQIVICDNLSSHKRSDIRVQIEAAGCDLIFLPPYSPDFNPIELIFSKLKEGLRRLAARTQEHLEHAIAQVLRTITTTDARNCFVACDYPLTAQP